TENLVHGSDGPESAAREIALFFPNLGRSRPPGEARWLGLACAEPERLRRPSIVPEPWFQSVVGRDMAVDLGTANTLVYVRGKGIVLDEPSIVAMDTRSGRPIAIGTEAK